MRNQILAICIVDNEMWFTFRGIGILCSVDLNSGELTRYEVIPNENTLQFDLFGEFKLYNGKIYMIPCAAEHLCIYDIESNSFEQIAIPIPEKRSNHYHVALKFNCSYVYNNQLILIPRTYPGVVIFDLSNESIAIVSDWVEKILEKENLGFFTGLVFMNDGVMQLASRYGHCIAEFDCNSRKLWIKENEYCSNERVWDITQLSLMKSGELNTIAYEHIDSVEMDDSVENYLLNFRRCYHTDNGEYLLSWDGTRLFFYGNGVLKKIEDECLPNNGQYCGFFVWNNRLHKFDYNRSEIQTLKEDCIDSKLCIDLNGIYAFLSLELLKNEMKIYESGAFTIKDLCNYIDNGD